MRTQLLRNVSARFPAVRVLPVQRLLRARYGWHHEDCRSVSEALEGRQGGARGGCDCTHYCFSPNFWRVYFSALLQEVRGALTRSEGGVAVV